MHITYAVTRTVMGKTKQNGSFQANIKRGIDVAVHFGFTYFLCTKNRKLFTYCGTQTVHEEYRAHMSATHMSMAHSWVGENANLILPNVDLIKY